MITIDVVLNRVPELSVQDLERWIFNDWVRPDGGPGDYVFRDIDVARVLLIYNLRDEMDVNELAIPVVLLLLDQLYDLRRQLHGI